MLITSHWFACIWGMCADLQGEDYESFTWLDALYYATEAQVGRRRVGIFVNLPHSAHLVEVTSTTVQDAHHGLFEELSPSMCQTAMRLTQPSADLTTLWSELGDVDEVCFLCQEKKKRPDWVDLLRQICALPGGVPRAIAFESKLRAMPPPPPPPPEDDELAVMQYKSNPPPPAAPTVQQAVTLFLAANDKECLNHATKLALESLTADGNCLDVTFASHAVAVALCPDLCAWAANGLCAGAFACLAYNDTSCTPPARRPDGAPPDDPACR